MSRVLAYTTPARGHLFPVTPILDELHRRGHEITVRTLASQVPLMRDRGFDAAPIDPAIEGIAINDYLARTPLGAEKRSVRAFCERAELDAVDLQSVIDKHDPDALLVDINAWGAMIIAEQWGGPWASWCPYPLPVPSQDTPPFGPGLRPALGLAGRIRDAILRPIFFGSLERIAVPTINEVRDHLGVPPIKNAAQMFGGPPLLLYLTAEPFSIPAPTGLRTFEWSDHATGILPSIHRLGLTRWTSRSFLSRHHRSSRTTAGWCAARWKHFLVRMCTSWRRCPPRRQQASRRRQMLGFSRSSRTRRFCSERCAP
jgi:UDP:flavonoid glycosyltransferase YjiC (YdhE family)